MLIPLCCTIKWIIYMYTYIQPPLSLPPTPSFLLLRSMQSINWAPYATQPLSTNYLFTYGSVYTSMLVSYDPSSPSPAVSTISFSIMCLYLSSAGKFISTIFLYILCLVAESCSYCGLQGSSGNGLYPAGSSTKGNSPHKYTRVGCHAVLQGIFPNQRSKSGFPHCRQFL